jgi:hypothetical protein
VAHVEQVVAQVAAQKARPAGDHNPHDFSPPTRVRSYHRPASQVSCWTFRRNRFHHWPEADVGQFQLLPASSSDTIDASIGM